MAKIRKTIKVKIESAPGTLTDLTAFTKSVSGVFHPNEKIIFWQHPIRWLKDYLERRKLRKFLKPFMKDVVIEIRGPVETIPYDPWREYKRLHRN